MNFIDEIKSKFHGDYEYLKEGDFIQRKLKGFDLYILMKLSPSEVASIIKSIVDLENRLYRKYN